MNITHQPKKMTQESLKKFRDQFRLPISDEQTRQHAVPQVRRRQRGTGVHARAPLRSSAAICRSAGAEAESLPVPPLDTFEPLLKGTGEREISTTMAFVRMLGHPAEGQGARQAHRADRAGRIAYLRHGRPVPPDRYLIADGQKYMPEDADQLMFYREETGQILQEGINEAGGMCDWIAAATSYTTHNEPMIPFYIFYSMFGFQRIGDLAWAAGDMRSRGFLLGGTAGRTTLNGEGLQHEDGHSRMLAATIPELLSLRPDVRLRTRGHHAGRPAPHGAGAGGRVLLHHGDERELRASRRFREGAEEGIIKGMYSFRKAAKPDQEGAARAADGRGTILNEVIAAADLLKNDWDVAADLWSVPSFTELRREGTSAERWNLLHPTGERTQDRTSKAAEGRAGPGHRIDRLHARASPTRSAASVPRGASSCWAPTASAAATPGQAAPLLRSRPLLGHGRRAERAGRRRHDRAARSSPRRSRSTASTPSDPTR